MTWGVADLRVCVGTALVLDGVALDVPPGRLTVVIGGDGSGKSTLLRVVAGGLRPDAGTVRIPSAERIGYLPATSGVYPDLSVEENLQFRGAAYGLTAAEVASRSADLLGRVGLGGVTDRLGGELSGGMRQKLGVICAVLHRPDLLVLDEPTTGVDPLSRADLWALVATCVAGGTAVLASTTYLQEAVRAGQVAFLEEGRCLAIGPPEEVLARMPPAPPAPRQVPGTASGAAQHGGGGATGPVVLAEARRARREFGGYAAVDGVDLTVAAGEVVGLLGANGAGKTTLVRMLLGLLAPTDGAVEVLGAPPAPSVRRHLGYVPQGLGLYEDLTPAENLDFVRAIFAEHGDDGRGRSAAVEGFADVPVGQLALGLQRRLAFALALDHAPRLLVLDEPTSGVGPAAAAELWGTVRQATAAGAGALVTTHNLDEAANCDRLVIMAAGRVVGEGTLAAILGDARATRIEAADWVGALERLRSAGMAPALVGTALRVPGSSEIDVRAALGGIPALVEVVPATLDERFAELVTAAGMTS